MAGKDGVNSIATLVDSVFDEGEAAEFSSDEQVGQRCFELRTEAWEIGGGRCLGHDHGDGADRALFGAQTVTDAFVGVDDARLAVNEREDIALWASLDTCSAADAGVGMDFGMLGARAIGEEGSTCSSSFGLRFLAAMADVVLQDEHANDEGGDEPADEGFHNLL
jgi:hypothetical protein